MALKIIYNNLWRKGVAGTPTSEQPQFPIEDTQVDTLYQRFRTEYNDGTADIDTGYMDLGAAYDIDFVAILGHNISQGSGMSISFVGADDSSGTNAVSETVTWALGNIWHFFSASMTKQFVKVIVDDPANPNDYLELPTIICGKVFQPGRGFMPGKSAGTVDNSIRQQSDAMVQYSLSRPRLNVWQIAFEGLSDSDAEQIQAWIEECGVEHGFVICFDSDTPAGNTYFVRFADVPDLPVRENVNCWSWGASLIEVV